MFQKKEEASSHSRMMADEKQTVTIRFSPMYDNMVVVESHTHHKDYHNPVLKDWVVNQIDNRFSSLVN